MKANDSLSEMWESMRIMKFNGSILNCYSSTFSGDGVVVMSGGAVGVVLGGA